MGYFFQRKSLSVHIGQERNDFMCCFWVTKLHLSLCDPMDCSMPGLPVLYISWSLLKLMFIELVMPSKHLILCTLYSFCLPSFLTSESFPMSQIFASGGQHIGVSASASLLPMNIQSWFPLRQNYLISLLFKELSRVFSSTTVQRHQFFTAQWWRIMTL